MFYHTIKKNFELEKELMEKDKQEIANYTISIRIELRLVQDYSLYFL